MELLAGKILTNLSKSYKLIVMAVSFFLLLDHHATSSIEIDSKDLLALNSDHYDHFTSALSRYKRQISNKQESCQIPPNPLHTKYKILEKSETGHKPGDYVQTASVLGTTCNNGYNLISPFAQKYSICVNGKWEPSPTTCTRACPSLTSTSSTTVKCKYEGTLLPNCLNPVDETRAILSCNTLYEEASLEKNPIRVCKNGRWNPSIPQCYPSCGMKSPKGTANIVNGTNATPGDYPWQVGVYNTRKELICGGAIIDQHAVLSAAHCFTDHNGNVNPTKNYFIATGKYYRKYDDDRDLLAQYSNVRKIHVPEKYKGRTHFFGHDIAIVILTDPFTLTEVVQPVCVELNEESLQLDLSLNNKGIVTGWGQTKEGSTLSDVLKELVVPYIPYHKCFNEVPENFRRYITFDKICGGYTNSGTSVCGGDSGGALTFKNMDNNRYYVKGIVSTSPATAELACDSNTYSVYTATSSHINFMRDLVQYYQTQRPIECTQDDCADRETEKGDRCRFPNFPPNGKYTLVDQKIIYVPGDYVPISSMLTLSCDTGYEVNSERETQSYCVDKGQWMPALGSCKKSEVKPEECFVPGERGGGNCKKVHTCKPIVEYLQTPTISKEAATILKKYQCGFDGAVPKVCCYPNPPTEISIQTSPKPSILSPPDVSNHKNINLLPKECGIYGIKRRIFNGIKTDLFEFPWMALIEYELSNNTRRFLCAGTIINDRYILTAANCLSSPNRIIGVRVGEYNVMTARDCEIEGENIHVCADPVQDIKIQDIIPHLSYTSFPTLNDIGLLRLRTPMQFKRSVQPICLPVNNELKTKNFANTRLIITGWGSTETGNSSPDLLKVEVPLLSQIECHEAYKSFQVVNITQKHLCAGGKAGDACGGDSGGPLQGTKVVNNDLRYVQFGIISFGSKCGGTVPGVYTRIDYYVDWILDNIKI